MKLTSKERQQLKAKAHALRPVVLIGNQGLTENVQMEIGRALHDHELIKIRLSGSDREQKRQTFAEISATHQAELIQLVGNIGVVYLKRPTA